MPWPRRRVERRLLRRLRTVEPRLDHMSDLYGQVIQDPVIQEAWKRGPVHFEVCRVIANWYDKGCA